MNMLSNILTKLLLNESGTIKSKAKRAIVIDVGLDIVLRLSEIQCSDFINILV